MPVRRQSQCKEPSNGLIIRKDTASSGAMMAQTFSFTIPQSPGMDIGLCKRETPSSLKSSRGRKVPRRPMFQNPGVESPRNPSAGRERPPAGHFYLELRFPSSVQHEALHHRELRGNDVVGRRCEWDERQDWHASRSLRASHKALHWLVPTQREQDLLPLSNNSQRRLAYELPVRPKKNRYEEVLRAGYFFENQEGLHFQMMTCNAVFQRDLLLPRIWNNWAATAIAVPVFAATAQNLNHATRNCLYWSVLFASSARNQQLLTGSFRGQTHTLWRPYCQARRWEEPVQTSVESQR